jgi:hypothetical protein
MTTAQKLLESFVNVAWCLIVLKNGQLLQLFDISKILFLLKLIPLTHQGWVHWFVHSCHFRGIIEPSHTHFEQLPMCEWPLISLFCFKQCSSFIMPWVLRKLSQNKKIDYGDCVQKRKPNLWKSISPWDTWRTGIFVWFPLLRYSWTKQIR